MATATGTRAASKSRFVSVVHPERQDALERIYQTILEMKGKVADYAAGRLLYIGSNIDLFGAADISLYLNPLGTASAMERESSGRVPLWSLLRNILVLVPLVLTWVALALVTRDPNFGSGSSLVPLSGVAILDIFLFILLIVVGVVADSSSRAGRTRSQMLLDQLDLAVRVLSEEKADHPTIDPKHPEKWAQLVQQQLDEVRKLLNEASGSISGVATATGSISTQMVTFEKSANALAGSASALATNADRYISVGEAIGKQVASLDKTQQDLSARIGTVAGSMGKAADAVDGVAKQLTVGLKTELEGLTRNVTGAASSLNQIDLHLEQTTQQLERAAATLATVDIAGGGLLGWLMRRRAHRRRARTTP